MKENLGNEKRREEVSGGILGNILIVEIYFEELGVSRKRSRLGIRCYRNWGKKEFREGVGVSSV